jgi:hypothetical protein
LNLLKNRLARKLLRSGRRVQSPRETRLSTWAKAQRLAAGSISVNEKDVSLKITKLELFKVPPRWLFLKVSTDADIVGWGEPIVEGAADSVEATVREMNLKSWTRENGWTLGLPRLW